MPPNVKEVLRAKKDGALEVWLTKLVKGELSATQWLMLISGVVAVAAVGFGVQLVFGSKVRALRPSDAGALKQVFFSGEPWLVECTTGSKGSPLLYEAEGSLVKPIQAGTLDCGAILPSGKTTLERFKLSPNKHDPVFLFAANLDRPVVATREFLGSGESLAKWANGLSKPRLLAASTSELFEQHCLRRRWCGLVVTANNRLATAERKALMAIAGAYRSVRFVTLDASKLKLSLDLPGGLPEPTSARSTLLLLKQGGGEGEGAKEFKESAVLLIGSGLEDGPASAATIGAALAPSATDELSDVKLPEGFTTLPQRPSAESKAPKIARPVEADSAFDQRRQSWKTEEPVTKTLSDEELRALRAERAAEVERLEKEREMQRRAEMSEEEQQAGNLVEDLEGEEGEEEDEAPEEEVEEEEIE